MIQPLRLVRTRRQKLPVTKLISGQETGCIPCIIQTTQEDTNPIGITPLEQRSGFFANPMQILLNGLFHRNFGTIFTTEVEPHRKLPSCQSLIEFLCFFCNPSNTFKLTLAVLCAFSIHRIQDVRTFYSYVFLLLRFKDG
jgi:hypothetical protein